MKKTILTLALAIFSAVSFAQSSISLTEGDISIVPVTSAKIVGVRAEGRRCPNGAECMPMFKMTLAFTLGCLNKLGPVTAKYTYNERTTKYDLFVSASEIVNKRTMAAFCVRANVQNVDIIVSGGMDKDNTNLELAQAFANASADVVVTPPVRCTREFMPVCGTKPMTCPAGRICAAVMVEKTYGNKCLMRADGATLVHTGACKQ